VEGESGGEEEEKTKGGRRSSYNFYVY